MTRAITSRRNGTTTQGTRFRDCVSLAAPATACLFVSSEAVRLDCFTLIHPTLAMRAKLLRRVSHSRSDISQLRSEDRLPVGRPAEMERLASLSSLFGAELEFLNRRKCYLDGIFCGMMSAMGV